MRPKENEEQHRDQAIACALLGVPEFRQKAGLHPYPCDTSKTIALAMGVSLSRVQQIERAALAKIRVKLSPDLLEEFLELFPTINNNGNNNNQ